MREQKGGVYLAASRTRVNIGVEIDAVENDNRLNSILTTRRRPRPSSPLPPLCARRTCDRHVFICFLQYLCPPPVRQGAGEENWGAAVISSGINYPLRRN